MFSSEMSFDTMGWRAGQANYCAGSSARSHMCTSYAVIPFDAQRGVAVNHERIMSL